MIRAGAPLAGWGAFLALAVAAALGGAGAQLAFAALAIGVLGLPHGAGDLAIVAPARRFPFLMTYLGTIAAVLLLWTAVPVLGLGLLLACSAIHFALDDEEQDIVGWSRGLCLVAVPAVLHRDGIAALFVTLTHDPVASDRLAGALRIAGVAGLAIVAAAIVRRRAARHGDAATLAILAMVAAMPPLVGFATGFVVLHAARQTLERRRALGCVTIAGYLRLVGPVLAGAAVVLAAIAAAVAARGAGDASTLFAGIAALAMPHMLVTPLWQSRDTAAPRRSAGRHAGMPVRP